MRDCVHAEAWCDREDSLPAQREHRTGAFALISAATAAASPSADVSTAAAAAAVEIAAVATAAPATGTIAATVCAVRVRAGRGTAVLASEAIGAEVARVVAPVREAAVATHAAAAVATRMSQVDRPAASLPPTRFAGSVLSSAAA
jgi:hypothetical protein